MIKFFKRAKQRAHRYHTLKEQKNVFSQQINVKKYTIPDSIDLPPHITKNQLENLIKKKRIAPIHQAEDICCDDDKQCIICYQTVRQGMNALKCCGQKQYICSYCLIKHPKYDIVTNKIRCDICKTITDIVVLQVNIQEEIDKMNNQTKEDEVTIEQLLKTRLHREVIEVKEDINEPIEIIEVPIPEPPRYQQPEEKEIVETQIAEQSRDQQPKQKVSNCIQQKKEMSLETQHLLEQHGFDKKEGCNLHFLQTIGETDVSDDNMALFFVGGFYN
ncbi:RING-type domain-containing protein [Entamoeba marina]